MKTILSSTLLLSFLFLSSLLHLSLEYCNPHDYKVLLQIKKSLNNPYHLASWDPSGDCCDWNSVTCSPKNNRITGLWILSADVSGQIPPSVGDLPYLEYLIFHNLLNLTGEIPPAISKLHNLKSCMFSMTHLTGPVPAFFSTLKNLKYLDLSFNKLSGSIPGSLSILKKLELLYLNGNKLTGQIPNSFGKFGDNIDIDLSDNKLSGKIPKSFGNLNYRYIDLSRNKLEGDASMLFGSKKTNIRSVNISGNLFEFYLTIVWIPESLVLLDISHNKIIGSLPKMMASLKLKFLNVSYNRMCGKIPIGGKLQHFEGSSYFHNQCLCGAPLPACK